MPQKFQSLPDADELRELFVYNPELGVLFWKVGVRRGEIAGSHRAWDVYVRIGCRQYAAHRLIWKMVTGQEPVDQIDHVNCNPYDNRWENLREATGRQNMTNKREARHAKYGLKGVTRIGNRYKAKIGDEYLGLFATPEEAADAYASRAKEKHGEFARGYSGQKL